MPYPEFDKTVAALDQVWLFGAQAGANYRGILTTKFNAAGNKTQIEAALSLGNYLNHNDTNKQQRAALRAVLLAKFLMKNTPVSESSIIKKQNENLDIATLKRVFTSLFPALQDNGNRPAWAPGGLTDPSTLAAFSTARVAGVAYPAVPAFRFIVHAVGNYKGKVFDTPNILSQYEVLSMSLMAKENSHAHDPQGVILRVPENNILAASPTDVAVQNYAPAFSAAAPAAVTITDNLLDVATRTGGLKTPDYLLQNVRGYPYYNEVVVCGRGAVPLPHGTTGQMTAIGLFVLTDANGVVRGDAATAAERVKRVTDCGTTHTLPVLYIPNAMATPAL